jgi:ribosomal protein S18 acetylase RimI-like enzyme
MQITSSPNVRTRDSAGRSASNLNNIRFINGTHGRSSDRVTFSGGPASGAVALEGIDSSRYTPAVLRDESTIPQVVDFQKKIFGKLDGLSPKATKADYINAYIEDFQEGAFAHTIYNKQDKKLIASATLKRDGYIFCVGVHPKHRQQGIARAMMKGLIKEAQRRKLYQIYLYATNPHAITLYESLGFRTVENRSTPEEKCLALKLSSLKGKNNFMPFKFRIQRVFETVLTRVKEFFARFKRKIKL